MLWLELTVQVHPDAVESVSELLSRYTDESVAIEEPIELIEGGMEYRVLPNQPVILHAYLPMDGKEEETQQRITEGLWHLSSIGEHFVGELKTRVVKEEDWANAWKEYFHVTHIGQHIVIRPSWRDYTSAPDDIVLTLDPGMAFGTGLHPTTKMCLELVERYTKPDMKVFDVGTGSGILALAAAKLAATVYAVDTSSVAVESAKENAALNGLEDKITVALGSLDEAEATRLEGQFDFVVANILAHIIGFLAPHLAKVMAPDALLVVSGIIEARRQDAEGPLQEAGLELIDEQRIEDWLALTYRKRK